MILRSILDIAPNDPLVQDMDRLCKNFGLMDMSQVYLQTQDLAVYNGGKILLETTQENAWDNVRICLAVSAFSLAGMYHEKFEIEIVVFGPLKHGENLQTIPMNRVFDVEALKKNMSRFLLQALTLMEKFEV